MHAALMFAPDAYALDGQQIMGRRAAGVGFLRAAVEGRGTSPLIGYTPDRSTAKIFAEAVRSIDPAAQTQWVPHERIDLLRTIGVLHRPDVALAQQARMRLRSGAAGFSLTGITHTLSSPGTLETIAGLMAEPIMPWDALICTSSAGLGVLRSAFEAGADYLRWRTGGDSTICLPQLPVIPLGIHTSDLRGSPEKRDTARVKLGIAEDEIAVLYAGRLSVAGKAHPFQMCDALRTVAERTGASIVLIQAGNFFNAAAEQAWREATGVNLGKVRPIFINGGDQPTYQSGFEGADIFISLADSVQETFGLTPVEAMAAGLPVIVSDWNGYKETVRDGIDGFRIASWAPGDLGSEAMGFAFEMNQRNYDMQLSRMSTTVSVDPAQLVARIEDLVVNPDLRRRMGCAGSVRAQTEYDWRIIYPRYLALWTELNARRQSAAEDSGQAAWLASAPRTHPAHDNPGIRFGHYPSSVIDTGTHLCAAPDANLQAYQKLTEQTIFSMWRIAPELVSRIFETIGSEAITIEAMARELKINPGIAIELSSRLAKMNLIILSNK